MKRDLKIGLLATIATIAPSLLLAALGAPGGLYLAVAVGCGAGVVVAFGRRWHRQAVARTESQTTHLRSAIGIAATAGGMPTYWTEHSITPETLTQIQQLIAALGVRRVLELAWPVDLRSRWRAGGARCCRSTTMPAGRKPRPPWARRTFGLCQVPHGAAAGRDGGRPHGRGTTFRRRCGGLFDP